MKQRVDYRGFSLRRLNEPHFSHARLLAGWIGYFALYFITENLIPIEKCHSVWCRLDDLISFNEFFVIFYVGWYALVFGALAYTFFYDVENFRKIQIFIMITQAIAMATYIIWPSRQDLRPETFERSNFLTWVMGIIYGFDTSTGVCPSLHVAYSLGILSAVLKDRLLKPVWKILLTAFVIMICLSVCFVKQHSAVDVFAALPVALIAELLVWKDYWFPKLKGEKKDA